MRQRLLLDREGELGHLRSLVERAAGGSGGALFVIGPPGIGKTRLVEEAVEVAAANGTRVVSARAHPLEQDFAFSLVLQLLESVVHGPERELVLGGVAAPAARLFEGGPLEAADATPEALYPLLHGLFWATVNLAAGQPLLVVFDDAHWADVASLRFLAYLVQRLADVPIAVVVTMRPAEGVPTTELLVELGMHDGIEVVEPSALSRLAVENLVHAELPEAGARFCATCHEITGGNPFLVVELLRALPEGSVGSDGEAEQITHLAPRSISRSVLGRLGRLPQAAIDVARAVAVLGGAGDLGLAATVSDRAPDEAAAVLDDLVNAFVLGRDGEAVRFLHTVVSQAVLSEIPPGQQADLDFRAARALRDRGAPPPQVAVHLLGTPGRGDVWAVEMLRETASRALAEGQPEIAVRYLRRAMAEGCADEQLQAETLRELGGAEALVGDPEAAVHLEAAAARLADPDARARALGVAARVHGVGGRSTDAARCYRDALALTDEPSLREDLETGWAALATVEGGAAAPALFDDVPGRASAGSDNGLVHRGWLAQLALARTQQGAPRDEVLGLARRALDHGRLLLEGTSESLSVYVVSGVLSWYDALPEAIGLLDAAIADARLRGSTMAHATASYCRALPMLRSGRVGEALADIEVALDARAQGWELFDAAAVAVAAWIHLARDDAAAAQAVLDSLPDESASPDRAAVSWVAAARGDLALLRGQPAAALAHYLEAGRILESFDYRSATILPWRSRAAVAHHHLGDDVAARALIDDELALAEAAASPRAIAVARLALAEVAGSEEALAEAERASALLAESPSVLVRIEALLAQGVALRELERRAEAAERLRAALDLAEQTDARALAERARAELHAAGYRPRRAALSGPGSLTPSERRVAELAATGVSNREIAEALFVTVKTVEFHLGNAFSKCGVRSRGELAELFSSNGDPDLGDGDLLPSSRRVL